MPRINHIIERPYTPSFRAEKIIGLFDVPVTQKLSKRWELNVPIEDKPWSIGLITGASGTGKTTIAQLLCDTLHKNFNWRSPCLLDDFPEKVDVSLITEILSKVGFSSPPSWLLPFSSLSNGQKFRVELARCIFEYQDKPFIFDEFTSFVDRPTAKISAFAFQKVLRKFKKSFIAVTCHQDVEPWLQPDWVLNMDDNSFKWGCLRRPTLQFDIQRIHRKAWRLFKDYHYLNGNINNSAICFGLFINDILIGFSAWIPHLGKTIGKIMRAHRTVILPDYQGLGLGTLIVDEIAAMWLALGYRVVTGSAHPTLIAARQKSPRWRLRALGRTGVEKRKSSKHASNRLIARFEFSGKKMDLEEAQKLYAR